MHLLLVLAIDLEVTGQFISLIVDVTLLPAIKTGNVPTTCMT